MSAIRLAVALVVALGASAHAQTADAPVAGPVAGPEAAMVSTEIAALSDAMRLAELFAVLRDEGLALGRDYDTDMFPSGGGPGWAEAVDRIYAVERLQTEFVASLQEALGGDAEALADILAFYRSDLGQRVVALEIEARRAFLDEAAEDAARVAADRRRADRDPRADQIARFIAAGDLLEMNVAGALTGNLAFMTGMNDSGAYGPGMPQDKLLQDVWGQEAQIREDTQSWLNAYLGLAYQPLDDADLDSYIAFMDSPAGQRLNGALFVAFDRVFRGVSYDLGRAAGLAMLGRDI